MIANQTNNRCKVSKEKKDVTSPEKWLWRLGDQFALTPNYIKIKIKLTYHDCCAVTQLYLESRKKRIFFSGTETPTYSLFTGGVEKALAFLREEGSCL